MKTAKHFLIVSMIILAGALLSACGGSAEPAAESTPIPIVVADNQIVAEGRLEPIHYVDIAFNANGTVSEVLVSEGGQVTEGQVIARLENSEARQADVANAEEAFLQAQQAFDSAEALMDREAWERWLENRPLGLAQGQPSITPN